MPETAVNEDSNTFRRKIKIRFPRKINGMQFPALQPGAHQCHTKATFGCFVAFPTHRRHNSRTLRRNISEATTT